MSSKRFDRAHACRLRGRRLAPGHRRRRRHRSPRRRPAARARGPGRRTALLLGRSGVARRRHARHPAGRRIRPLEELRVRARDLRRDGEVARPALNVNTLDEVPDSSWFTNRLGRRDMTIDEIVRGPNQVDGPAPGTWQVTGRPDSGITPKFTIRDARGDTYLIKLDPAAFPELPSSVEADLDEDLPRDWLPRPRGLHRHLRCLAARRSRRARRFERRPATSARSRWRTWSSG